MHFAVRAHLLKGVRGASAVRPFRRAPAEAQRNRFGLREGAPPGPYRCVAALQSNYVLQRTPGTFYVLTYHRGPAPLNTALDLT